MQFQRKTGGASSQSVSCAIVCRLTAGIIKLTAFSRIHALPMLKAETVVSVAIAAQTARPFDELSTIVRNAASITMQNSVEPKNDSIHKGVA